MNHPEWTIKQCIAERGKASGQIFLNPDVIRNPDVARKPAMASQPMASQPNSLHNTGKGMGDGVVTGIDAIGETATGLANANQHGF